MVYIKNKFYEYLPNFPRCFNFQSKISNAIEITTIYAGNYKICVIKSF